jgi:hypothetical protein
VGHRFSEDYRSELALDVYDSLLDLVAKRAAELAELADLNPRDTIDVQSFIWVVRDYRDGREQPQV